MVYEEMGCLHHGNDSSLDIFGACWHAQLTQAAANSKALPPSFGPERRGVPMFTTQSPHSDLPPSFWYVLIEWITMKSMNEIHEGFLTSFKQLKSGMAWMGFQLADSPEILSIKRKSILYLCVFTNTSAGLSLLQTLATPVAHRDPRVFTEANRIGSSLLVSDLTVKWPANAAVLGDPCQCWVTVTPQHHDTIFSLKRRNLWNGLSVLDPCGISMLMSALLSSRPPWHHYKFIIYIVSCTRRIWIHFLATNWISNHSFSWSEFAGIII